VVSETCLVEIYCPRCGRRLQEPFARSGGPVAYRHRVHTRGHPCTARLIVLPEQSRAVEIPWNVSFAAALREALREEAVA
jgi:hypothetical protein